MHKVGQLEERFHHTELKCVLDSFSAGCFFCLFGGLLFVLVFVFFNPIHRRNF